MITSCRHNFYGRSRFSSILFYLHAVVHLLMYFLLFLFLYFTLRGHLPIILSPFTLLLPPPATFIVSLTAYTFFLNRSVIVPFFHPFLHPLFVSTAGFLFALRLLLYPLGLVIGVFFVVAGRYL
ncbi:hypothetical protein M378DRAFT_960566 [Amanita muscaria Koide BX008]|uniref:Uncharacterized protein n=1 Tax=Amanita muscaria (strain Koide BX008) TaxID=946122 RepID=A0A0C2WTG2_AMAMK|nr:hypothetical protein M378DRAFT_960566 [Amanita muscaria Koide BX008]